MNLSAEREQYLRRYATGTLAEVFDLLDASRAQAEALAEGLSRIAHQATDLPHAQRIDRDEMRAVAREALAAYRKGQAHSADDPQRKADRAGA